MYLSTRILVNNYEFMITHHDLIQAKRPPKNSVLSIHVCNRIISSLYKINEHIINVESIVNSHIDVNMWLGVVVNAPTSLVNILKIVGLLESVMTEVKLWL